MFVKNFLKDDAKRGDRALWIVGALALTLFAFLATGMIDGEPANQAVEGDVAENATTSAAAGTLDAAEPTTPKKTSWRERRKASAPKGPGMGSIWQTLGGLGVVLALLFGGAAFARKFLKKMRMRPQGSKVLEMVDCIPIGPKKQIFVIEAYGRKLVVGSTPESMSVLSEFGADEIEAAETDEPLAFAEKLNQSLARPATKPAFLEVEA